MRRSGGFTADGTCRRMTARARFGGERQLMTSWSVCSTSGDGSPATRARLTPCGGRSSWRMSGMRKLEPPISPALLRHEKQRANDVQNRIADRITTFAGSMVFVYLHIVWFSCWIAFGVEK